MVLLVDWGSGDEAPEEHGAAHFLEHMLFKGTARLGVGEVASAVEALGGDLNAYTTQDHTAFHLVVPAAAWARALDVLADMVQHSAIDADELDRERGVVLDELAADADDPASVVAQVVRQRLFAGHPYGHPVLGTEATVSSMTREALVAFWRRGYRADRMVLGVAGDVDPAGVLAATQRHLGELAPGPQRTPSGSPRPRPGVVHVDRGFDTALVEIGWPAPAYGHPDVPALDLLAVALGDGAASLLATRLQAEDGTAFDPWATLDAQPLGGQLSLGLHPLPDATVPATTGALGEVERIRDEGLPGVWLDRARTLLSADLLLNSESLEDQALDLAWYAARTNDPEAGQRYLEDVARVSAARVREVARRWLSAREAVVVAHDPDLRPAELRRALAPPTPAPAHAGSLRRSTLSGGVRLVHLPDPEAPLMSVCAAAPGGGSLETPATAGAGRAWAAMLTAGAGEHDAAALSEARDRLGARLTGQSSHDHLTVSAVVPTPYAADALELLGAVLTEPHMETEEWERVRPELLDDVRTRDDHPEDAAQDALWAALWPDHPWRLPMGGTTTSLSRMGPRTLQRWHRRHLCAGRAVVAVVGGTPRRVEEVLGDWLSDLPECTDLPALPVPRPPRARRSLRAGRSQAHLLLGFRGATRTGPDRWALELAAVLLGRQGGRLFLELRERRGLAYSVWADSLVGTTGGVWSTGLATAPQHLGEARDALHDQLARLATDGPTAAELDAARAVVTGMVLMDRQTSAERARSLALALALGEPDDLAHIERELRRTGADDIRRVLTDGLARLTEIVVEPRA